MGNTTRRADESHPPHRPRSGHPAGPSRPDPSPTVDTASELLGRIGVGLRCQRVELFSVVAGRHASIASRWTPSTATSGSVDDDGHRTPPVPLDWFPWSLGNIKPNDYVFVRNAGQLPLDLESDRTVADLEMSSALYIPLMRRRSLDGAVAVYWSVERRSWPTDQHGRIREWAVRALDEVSPTGTLGAPDHRR